MILSAFAGDRRNPHRFYAEHRNGEFRLGEKALAAVRLPYHGVVVTLPLLALRRMSEDIPAYRGRDPKTPSIYRRLEMGGGEGDDDFEQIADIGNEVMDVLSAEGVVVKLRGGDKITGSLVGFSIKKKPAKKEGKESTCSASISVQTKQGVLQIDCETVDSVEAAPSR